MEHKLNIKLSNIIKNEDSSKYNEVRITPENKLLHICYYEKEVLTTERWMNEGKLHRPFEEGPAVTEYYDNGNPSYKEWVVDSVNNSVNDLPCIVRFYITGEVNVQKWYKNGVMHRDNAPAIIKYNINGSRVYESWYTEGVLTNKTGPAIVFYDDQGQIKRKQYFIDNQELTEEEFNALKF